MGRGGVRARNRKLTSQNSQSQESQFHNRMLSLREARDAPKLCGLLPFNVFNVNIYLERCEYFHFVALAVGVDLGRHLIRKQVKAAPGELHVGQRKNTWTQI